MKKIFTTAIALSAVLASVPAAATVFPVGSSAAGGPSQSVTFTVSPEPTTDTVFNAPTIVGTISAIINTAGTYTDDFQFTIPQTGVGSGSVISTSTNPSNGLVLTSVTFDGQPVTITSNGAGGQQASISGLWITSLVKNDLVVTYTAAGGASYGGQLTFSAVPEPTTWAMFLVGFGMLGFALRSKRSQGLVAAAAA